MIVTATDIKNNFGKYIRLAANEEIIITKNGSKVGKLIAYNEDYDDCLIKDPSTVYNYDRKKVTYEEFKEISANSEDRYEYIDGEIYLLDSPKTAHQRILYEMSGIFYNWFKDKKCTPMIAPYDIKLSKNEKNNNVVQPDLMVICDLEEKLGEDDYYHGVPQFMVEVISPSSKTKDYLKKLDLYMSCGVEEYWIVDPYNKEVFVYIFKDKDIYKNKAYDFNEIIESYYFKGLKVYLRDFA